MHSKFVSIFVKWMNILHKFSLTMFLEGVVFIRKLKVKTARHSSRLIMITICTTSDLNRLTGEGGRGWQLICE